MTPDDFIESPDPAELAAMTWRRARLRMTAADLVRKAEAGETVDPHSLEWARQVVRNNRPAGGWLGEESKA